MRILMTGASGFIGKQILNQILSEGHSLVSLGRRAPEIQSSQVTFHPFDLNSDRLTFPEPPFDTILHFAGIASGEGKSEKEYMDINFKSTERLVRYAKDNSIPHFIFSSSASVYGRSDSIDEPLKEDSFLNGSTDYARSKILAESLIRKELTGYTIFRISSVYGIGGKGFVNKLIKLYRKKLFPYPLGGRGKKSFIHIQDLIEFVIRGLNQKKFGVFNLAHPEIVSYKELLKEIERNYPGFALRTPLPGFLETWDFPKGLNSKLKPLFLQSLIDPQRAIHEFGFQPKVGMVEGMKGLRASEKL